MLNSSAPRTRYQAGVTSRDRDQASTSGRSTGGLVDQLARLHLPGQDDRAHDGDHEQDGGDLEGEEVVGEERLAELVDVGDAILEVVLGGLDGGAVGRTPASVGRAPVASPSVEAMARSGRASTASADHDGRDALAADGSIDRSSARSTPSSMRTKRNRTTMAPA